MNAPNNWLDFNEDMRFPMRDTLKKDESGQGYLLRMGAINNFENARKFLSGKSWGSMPSELDAEVVSRWFGESVANLRWALRAANTATPKGRTLYAGHPLSRPTFINCTQPRVCPACLSESEHCKFSWDFSLVTACHRHRIGLIDRCTFCDGCIRWNRPGPNACSCYSPLSLSTASYVPQEVEFEFERWVQLRIRMMSPDLDLASEASSIFKTAKPKASLTKMIWPLSLDAGLLITYALSTAAGFPFVTPSTSPTGHPSLQRAKTALNAANELAGQIQEQRFAQMYIGSSKKAFELIASCLTHDFSAADRGFAQSLLSSLIKRHKIQRWSSAKPQLSQLMMF